MMTDPIAPPTILDASGSVSDDCPCRRCGYNLRGLHGDSRCPECGTAIGLSVLGDLLRFADLSWLQQLIAGVRLIFAGIVAVFVLNEGCIGSLTGAASALVNVLESIASLILLGGAWMVTAADPSGLGETQYGRVRRFIRGTLMLSAIAVVCDTFAAASLVPSNALSLFNDILQVVSLLFGFAGVLALFRYLAALAMRAPDPIVARGLRRVGWALIALVVLIVAVSAMGFAIAFTQFGGGATVAGGAVTYNTSQPATASATTTPAAGTATGTLRITSGGTTTIVTNPAQHPTLMTMMAMVAGLTLFLMLLGLLTLVGMIFALRRFQLCIRAQAELARSLQQQPLP